MKTELERMLDAVKRSGITSNALRAAIKNARRVLRVGKTDARVKRATYRLARAFVGTCKAIAAREETK